MANALQPYTRDREYLEFRITTAVWGTVLAVALLVTTVATWMEDSENLPGPFGAGPMLGRTLWTLASPQPWERADPRRWWARLAAAGVLVTILLTIGAASTAARAWAVSVCVAAPATFVAEAILWFAVHDGTFRPGGGLEAAMLLCLALTVWAGILAATARTQDTWPDQ